ncbi:hypothetical protein EXIGLDRAFT_81899 [Exidia glandulosa HHB12029]|uniref:Uncharacterized protein n=1 Tax=Exidia glandulosa HHB12029 TaxID=1314781 RepID=A0A166AI36_EXIGL|nr:hypothetical protein EXIGLDRAFT_81899 [Exidia glandulosa HHB12029]
MSSPQQQQQPGRDIDPGHSAILLSPPLDAAVQTPPQAPSTPESALTTRALRLTSNINTSPQRPVQMARRSGQALTGDSRETSQRLLDAVRELRGSIERSPNLAASLGIGGPGLNGPNVDANGGSPPDRRRAPTVIDFQQQRRMMQVRVHNQTLSRATQADHSTTETITTPTTISVRHRVRYNADGEELPPPLGGPQSRVASPASLLARPRPRRASSQETVIVTPNGGGSDGERELVAEQETGATLSENLRARIARADTILTALRQSPGMRAARRFRDGAAGASCHYALYVGSHAHEQAVTMRLRPRRLSQFLQCRLRRKWMRPTCSAS